MRENVYSEYKNLFINIRNEFFNEVKNFEKVQIEILKNIISENKHTVFGKLYNFEKIKSVRDFQKNVPVSKYEEYEDYIKKIMQGEKNILTKEEVILLEPTGGSSGVFKLIPYTKSLKKAFNKALKPWLSDLFLNFPGITDNPMYWSISPKTKIPGTNSVIKTGFENDTEYLEEPFSLIMKKQMVYPEFSSGNADDFWSLTSKCIESTSNLTFVSVWNPSLFEILTRDINKENLRKSLKVISCWGDGNSREYKKRLQNIFKDTYIQEKGLLSTEGVITIPIEKTGKVPAVSSHFFEFQDIETGKIKLLSELEENKNYSVIITTQGGLYRYKTGDIIRVYGKYINCPLITFLGRENNVSDYFGEKLNEVFITNILEKLGVQKTADFLLFSPYENGKNFYYVLFIETNEKIQDFEDKIENELLKNIHYKYARELNQLQKFRVKRIKNGIRQYIENCVRKGQKAGDVKPCVFSNKKDWQFE